MNDDAPSQTARLEVWLPFPTVAKPGHITAPMGKCPFDGAASDYPDTGKWHADDHHAAAPLPQECYHSNGKLARYIAQEINDYTACLKVGKKQGGAIQPVDSADENLIYLDPDCLQLSRLTASVVLLDDETRAPE